MYKFAPNLPIVSENAKDFLRFDRALVLGLDLEWSQQDEPTVLGISDGCTTVSVPYVDGLPYLSALLKNPEIEWVGHNFVGADKIVLQRLGISIPLEKIQDSIIWHWLVQMHLCKASGKASLEEDADERRGRGFMNLWTMLSLYTDWWHYKDCRDKKPTKKNPCPPRVFCAGACPVHEKYQYNGLDALGPLLALPKLQAQAKLRGVDRLYSMHRELMWVLTQMREHGVRVDVPYVYGRDRHPLGGTTGDSLDEQFRKEKDELAQSLPFNAQSPKAVREYFKEKHQLDLEDAQEETIREWVDDLEDGAPDELVALLDYKELGNGADRWFEPQYRDDEGWLCGYLDPNGYVHPRLNPFTSSGRLACSSPNFQNVAKRRVSRKVCQCGAKKEAHPTATCKTFRGESLGKKIRRAIIPPPGWYITRADYSNAENRYVLHRAGYTIPRDVDLHNWVKEIAGITEDMEISKREGSARGAAKSIQHANNILEGLQLKRPEALRTTKTKKEIAVGARLVCPDWTFRGQVVTFTGVNLARRTFGDASYENRAKALDISRRYFERFPGVRKFQKEVSKQVEVERAVRTPFGYCKLSFGKDEDQMKIAQGIQQQNPVAHATKLALIRAWKRWESGRMQIPVLQVHDEVLCYTRDSVPRDVAAAWLREDMEIPLEEVGGLVLPADASTGSNWRDQQKA